MCELLRILLIDVKFAIIYIVFTAVLYYTNIVMMFLYNKLFIYIRCIPHERNNDMSNYSHRGYEHRTGGYSRRRHKSSGFKHKNTGKNIIRTLVAVICTAAVIALIFVFFKYLKPFVTSFVGDSNEVTATIDTATADTADHAQGYYDIVDNKVFVSQGSAYLMFKGLANTALNYTAVMNSIATSVGDETEIYNIVIPTNTEFGLESQYRKDSNPQKDNLNFIAHGLMDRVNFVDIYDTLDSHKSEYIYYRTDENLTSLGAYYAYLEYMNYTQTDDTPSKKVYSLDTLAKKKGSIRRFEGDLLKRTIDPSVQPHGNQELFNNADTIDFYKLPVNYNSYIVDLQTGDYKEKDLFTTENVGEDPLSVFPARNTPLMVMYDLETKSKDKLLIVKDRYAEPMIGYLIPGCGEVHVADVQLYTGSLSEYVIKNDITRVLIINGIGNANNALYCQQLKDLFNSSRQAQAQTAD